MSTIDGTREKILDVASQLFLTKGYEKTTIKNIIDGLEGLTKGAIYHYFDSKEDIFNEVVTTIGLQNKVIFDEIKYDENLNGRQKLSKLVALAFDNANMDTIVSISPKLTESPKLFASFFKEMQELTVPDYFLPVITEGIEDGSIDAKEPQELAELLAILLNIWLNPLIFDNNHQSLQKKMTIINKALSAFNINFQTEYTKDS